MKLDAKHFTLIEVTLVLIGLIFITFSKINYDAADVAKTYLEERYNKLSLEKSFILNSAQEDIYKRIFDSPINAHNLVPFVEGRLGKLSQKYEVTLENIKIKKQEDHPLHSFLFSLKIQAPSDQVIYMFLEEIEKTQEYFVISDFFELKKSKHSGKILIEGQYAFEVYTKY